MREREVVDRMLLMHGILYVVFGNQQVGVEENLTVAPLMKVLIPEIYWGL